MHSPRQQSLLESETESETLEEGTEEVAMTDLILGEFSKLLVGAEERLTGRLFLMQEDLSARIDELDGRIASLETAVGGSTAVSIAQETEDGTVREMMSISASGPQEEVVTQTLKAAITRDSSRVPFKLWNGTDVSIKVRVYRPSDPVKSTRFAFLVAAQSTVRPGQIWAYSTVWRDTTLLLEEKGRSGKHQKVENVKKYVPLSAGPSWYKIDVGGGPGKRDVFMCNHLVEAELPSGFSPGRKSSADSGRSSISSSWSSSDPAVSLSGSMSSRRSSQASTTSSTSWYPGTPYSAET